MKLELFLLLVLSLIPAMPPAAHASFPHSTFSPRVQETQPTLSPKDRTRLAEAFRLGDQLGDRIWPGWSKAPFAVLLVTPEHEFLIRHPQPSADFVKLGYDETLKSDISFRKRTMSPSFLATFPAIPGSIVSTIVVGQAENTFVKTSIPWVVTLLHEHFHQLQDSQPNFYKDVNALNLSRGDESGMWMLNYAFPYDRAEVQEQFVTTSKLLVAALRSPKRERAKRMADYLAAREKFRQLVSEDDYKYLAFQFWKEGIARYTEFRIADLAAKGYRPTREFRALKDYRTFADFAQTTYEGIFRQLMTQKLGESKREVVYSFGAAEGLLLDLMKPGWRASYFSQKFDLGKL